MSNMTPIVVTTATTALACAAGWLASQCAVRSPRNLGGRGRVAGVGLPRLRPPVWVATFRAPSVGVSTEGLQHAKHAMDLTSGCGVMPRETQSVRRFIASRIMEFGWAESPASLELPQAMGPSVSTRQLSR